MRYLIALGGNALDDSKAMSSAAKAIALLYVQGNEIVLTHGNGPQVGELAIAEHESLATLTAQTQAWIGLNIESRIATELAKLKIPLSYSVPQVVLTKTIVDKSDPAFSNPTKPIGKFYVKKDADRMARKGIVMRKLINGYRRIVPSPKARDIIDKGTIVKLLKLGHIVISCGGGGVPVFKMGNKLHFADAVIDKDDASALLSNQISADRFIILTNVKGVFINFRKKGETLLKDVKIAELYSYLRKGYFEQGSMAPKVISCISFARHSAKPAIIGSMADASSVFAGKSGTVIRQ